MTAFTAQNQAAESELVRVMRENFRLRQEIVVLKKQLQANTRDREPLLLVDHFSFDFAS
jgi:hypothetical protein